MNVLKDIKERDTQEQKEQKVQAKKKKKAKRTKSFLRFADGGFLSRSWVIENLPFLFFCTLLLVVYVGYGYYTDKVSRQIEELVVEGQDMDADLNSEGAYLDKMDRYEYIADSCKAYGLFPSIDVAPQKIVVSKSEFNAD